MLTVATSRTGYFGALRSVFKCQGLTVFLTVAASGATLSPELRQFVFSEIDSFPGVVA
jgi:hypothetical protein